MSEIIQGEGSVQNGNAANDRPYNSDDRRVQKTEDALKRALSELLREKDVASISTTELCKRAGVGRNTFYAHYGSPIELLDSLKTQLRARFLNEVEESPGDVLRWLTDMYRIAASERDLVLALLAHEDTRKFFFENIDTVYFTLRPDASGNYNEIDPYDAVYTFCTGGAMWMVEWWLTYETDMSAETLARFVYAASQHVIGGMIRSARK